MNQQRSILILDPNTSWAEFCNSVLDKHGYESANCKNVETLFSLLKNQPENRCTLLLIDTAAIIDKPETIRDIFQSHPNSHIAIVLLFIKDEDLTTDLVSSTFGTGAINYVGKPFDTNGLLAIVEHAFIDYDIRKASYDTRMPWLSGKVLVVDDEEEWRKMLIDQISPQHDVDIRVAGTYQQASDEIENHDFDLVVSDLVLWTGDSQGEYGLKLLHQIRQKNPKTEIIVVSGTRSSRLIQYCYRKIGVAYYFNKKSISPKKFQTVLGLTLGK